MCTVTYLPVRDGFVITSNRDEGKGRLPALEPASYNGNTGTLVYPKDAQAGGTWFVIHTKGHVLVLLNGGWEKHSPQPPYRLSRGLILLELADSIDPLHAFTGIPLHNIEPFTLILAKNGSLYECRWDGNEKYIARMDTFLPHIWSSVTLYNPEMASHRRSWFRTWLQTHPTPGQEAILQFHRAAGDGQPHHDLLMNRDDKLLTVSITSAAFRRQNTRDTPSAAANRISDPADPFVPFSIQLVYQDTVTGTSSRQQIFPDPATCTTA